MNTENKNSKNSVEMLVIDLLIALLAIAADQLSKIQIRATLPIGAGTDLIPGVLQFLHHENSGASWGVMKGQTVFLLVITVVVVVAITGFLIKLPAEKKYLPMNIAGALVWAGALGNAIDRVDKKTVTDFIYFVPINFPIFNVADIFIVVATISMLVLFLFFYKEDDFRFLEKADKKAENASDDKSPEED